MTPKGAPFAHELVKIEPKHYPDFKDIYAEGIETGRAIERSLLIAELSYLRKALLELAKDMHP